MLLLISECTQLRMLKGKKRALSWERKWLTSFAGVARAKGHQGDIVRHELKIVAATSVQ